MKKCKAIAAALAIILSFSVSGCATMVRIDSSVPDADVVLEGKLIGKTPLKVRLANIAWEEYEVILMKDGYAPLKTELTKEIKIAPALFGWLFAVPLIWCYGPKPNQYFLLIAE